MFRRLNDALPGLLVGILLYGLLVELIGVWFVSDKVSYSIGLWYGIAIACGMAYNLAKVIYDSVTIDVIPDTHKTNFRILRKSMLRYFVVVLLFFLLGFFQFGSLLMAFVGVLGLKASAYVYPIYHRWRFGPDTEELSQVELSDLMDGKAEEVEKAADCSSAV